LDWRVPDGLSGVRKKSFERGVVEVKIYTTFAAPYEGKVIEERGC
jgi:hypothetical protein